MKCPNTHPPTQQEDCITNARRELSLEAVYLSLAPSLCFLLGAVWQTRVSSWRRIQWTHRRVQYHLLGTVIILVAIQATALFLEGQYSVLRSIASIAAASFSLLCALALLWLFCLKRSTGNGRPSVVMIYLLVTCIFDALRARTYRQAPQGTVLSYALLASIACKTVLLFLEWNDQVSTSNFQPDFPLMTTFLDIIRLGASDRLTIRDMPVFDIELTAGRLSKTFSHGYERYRASRYASLRTIMHSFKWQFIILGLPRLMLVFAALCQPVLAEVLLLHLGDMPEDARNDPDYAIVAAYAGVYLCIALSAAVYGYLRARFLTAIRTCLMSAVQLKLTRMELLELTNNNSSLSLVSADIRRVSAGFRDSHEVWASVIQSSVATYLLRRQLGVACVVPLVVALGCGLASALLNRSSTFYQQAWMKAMDDRVGFTAAMLSCAKSTRLKGLTRITSSRIRAFRSIELQKAGRFQLQLVWASGLAFTPDFLVPVFAFGIFILVARSSGEHFDATRAFVAITNFYTVTKPLSGVIQGLPTIHAALASFTRLDHYFNSPEQFDFRSRPIPTHDESEQKAGDSAIRVQNGSFGWTDSKKVLQNIDISVPRGQVAFIIGPIGCGKSTMCKALLGECRRFQGKVVLNTPVRGVAFCDQTVSLRDDSIRENILSSRDFDAHWYAEVLHACALMEDIGYLPHGDTTVVGSGGIALSGGQRKRVALARALYARKPIMLLDDVFSGLDAETASHIFREIFGRGGVARNHGTTVVLAMHDTRYLAEADLIVVLGSDGKIVQQGHSSELDLATIRSKMPIFDLESDCNEKHMNRGDDKQAPRSPRQALEAPVAIDDGVFQYYKRAAGSRTLLLGIILGMLTAVTYSAAAYWLLVWTSPRKISRRPDIFVNWSIFSALQTAVLLFSVLLFFQALVKIMKAVGAFVHKDLLQAINNAPWSFFSSLNTGDLLARFATDLQVIDAELPLAVLNFTTTTMFTLAHATLMIISFVWTSIAFVAVAVALYILQRSYYRTSVQLRTLELEAMSRFTKHHMETLAHLPTTRAFGCVRENLSLGEKLIERSQLPAYYLAIVQTALKFTIELIVAGLATMVALFAVMQGGGQGLAGLALTQVMSLTLMKQGCVLSWAQLGTSMSALGRVKAFVEQVPPDRLNVQIADPPSDWPSRGKIELQSVTACYDTRPALENITFTVEAGQKIGVCGRTGSGKSSLLLALLRMIDLKGGSIRIDGIELADISGETIRTRLSALPQDAEFLPGTLRETLDPAGTCSDAERMEALSWVGLGRFIDDGEGLSKPFRTELLSHGERQLLALAATSLTRSTVVLIDEPTSQVDEHTRKLMHAMIQDRFAHCTVISVSHDVESLLDFDRILLLAHGEIQDYDTPEALLSRNPSLRQALQT